MPHFRKEVVIFSIDNDVTSYDGQSFLKYISALEAVDRVTLFKRCIGKSNDELELSYLMYTDEFKKYVETQGWVDKQKTFFKSPGDQRQPCYIEYNLQDRPPIILGKLRSCNPERLPESWTYSLESQLYFTA